MAYEKNTKVPIVIAPVSLSDGTNESQGKYIWKCQPVLYSQMADPIIQLKQSKKRNSTIYKQTKTNISLNTLNGFLFLFNIVPITPMIRKLSSLSMVVRLNCDFPEFCMSFVSLPAKITIP